MTSIPPGQANPENGVRTVSLRKPLAMVYLVLLMVVLWGTINASQNRSVLKQLDDLHRKVDSLGPTKSE
jgi:hypothetical protein